VAASGSDDDDSDSSLKRGDEVAVAARKGVLATDVWPVTADCKRFHAHVTALLAPLGLPIGPDVSTAAAAPDVAYFHSVNRVCTALYDIFTNNAARTDMYGLFGSCFAQYAEGSMTAADDVTKTTLEETAALVASFCPGDAWKGFDGDRLGVGSPNQSRGGGGGGSGWWFAAIVCGASRSAINILAEQLAETSDCGGTPPPAASFVSPDVFAMAVLTNLAVTFLRSGVRGYLTEGGAKAIAVRAASPSAAMARAAINTAFGGARSAEFVEAMLVRLIAGRLAKFRGIEPQGSTAGVFNRVAIIVTGLTSSEQMTAVVSTSLDARVMPVVVYALGGPEPGGRTLAPIDSREETCRESWQTAVAAVIGVESCRLRSDMEADPGTYLGQGGGDGGGGGDDASPRYRVAVDLQSLRDSLSSGGVPCIGTFRVTFDYFVVKVGGVRPRLRVGVEEWSAKWRNRGPTRQSEPAGVYIGPWMVVESRLDFLGEVLIHKAVDDDVGSEEEEEEDEKDDKDDTTTTTATTSSAEEEEEEGEGERGDGEPSSSAQEL